MNWKTHDYDNIPGTYVFNGEIAHAAYGLNKLLFSFNREENRNDFAADPGAYADRFGLTAEQKRALLEDDYLQLIRLGGNIYYVAKLAVPRGLTMQDTSAAFKGITTEEFKTSLEAWGEGLEQRLEQEGGFWNG